MSDKSRNNKLALTITRIIREKKPRTIKELIVLTKEKLQISDEDIVDLILKLQREGKINLLEQPSQTSPNLAAHLKKEQTYWFWAIVATTLATVVIIFTLQEDLYPLVYLRYFLGAIFVLWLPGYTFLRVLFPVDPSTKKTEKKIDTIERIALSFGMSLALVPIVGLLLNYTPWGIRLTPIVLSLLALTIIFAVTAMLREHQRIK